MTKRKFRFPEVWPEISSNRFVVQSPWYLNWNVTLCRPSRKFHMLKNAEGIINHRWNRIGNSFKSHNNDIRWFSVEEKKVCENSNVHSWAIVFRAVYGFLTHFSNDPLSRCVKKWRIFQEWWFGNVVKNEWVLSLLMINGFLNSWWCINERSCRKKMRDCCLKSTWNFFKKLSLFLPIINETFWPSFPTLCL